LCHVLTWILVTLALDDGIQKGYDECVIN